MVPTEIMCVTCSEALLACRRGLGYAFQSLGAFGTHRYKWSCDLEATLKGDG